MRLAVTRDHSQLGHLYSEATARKIEIVPLPLTRQEQVPFKLPFLFDLKRIDWLFFTSANGVSSFFEQIDAFDLELSEKIKIAAVGKKTSVALEKLGRKASFVPSDSYGQLLFAEFIARHENEKISCLYARAEEVIFDPTGLFVEAGFKFDSIVCYKTVYNELEKKAVDSLTEQDYLLFTAPSNVAAFDNLFGPPLAKAIAIGRTTESKMRELHWSAYAVMNEADIEKVWEYL